MIKPIFAVSVLALSLLPPVSYAGDNDYCSTIQPHRGDYAACTGTVSVASTKALEVVNEPRAGGHRRVGQYIDESPEDSHQRSSNH